MVEMYVWLLVTLAVAVGVLMLAGILSPGDRDDPDDPDDPAHEAPSSAWWSLWQDFLSATSSLRARLARLRHPADAATSPDTSPARPGGRTAGHARAGQTATPVPASASAPVVAPKVTALSRFERDAAESNTSFEEFFQATATSEPAYLDAAQLSDALNSLRR